MFATKQPRKRGGYRASLIISFAAIVVAGLLLMNRQYIVDQMSIWQYQPTSIVTSIVSQTTMTPLGERYFYASHPAVEGSESFKQNCARVEPGAAILGCYTGGRIFIYDVTDPQLDGIREVTGAHEMLHAAYDRMPVNERARIDALLEVEYMALRDNKEFAERMAFYARTEPGERDNELHSIIGTEVENISPELDAYYERYFTERSSVVALHSTYASVFTRLQTKAADLTDQLVKLDTSITEQSNRYNRDVSTLNDDIARFNANAAGGGFLTQAEFQSQRSVLVSNANELDVLRSSINADIVRYDQLQSERRAIAGQFDALNRSIDSTLAPAPSL